MRWGFKVGNYTVVFNYLWSEPFGLYKRRFFINFVKQIVSKVWKLPNYIILYTGSMILLLIKNSIIKTRSANNVLLGHLF